MSKPPCTKAVCAQAAPSKVQCYGTRRSCVTHGPAGMCSREQAQTHCTLMREGNIKEAEQADSKSEKQHCSIWCVACRFRSGLACELKPSSYARYASYHRVQEMLSARPKHVRGQYQRRRDSDTCNSIGTRHTAHGNTNAEIGRLGFVGRLNFDNQPRIFKFLLYIIAISLLPRFEGSLYGQHSTE